MLLRGELSRTLHSRRTLVFAALLVLASGALGSYSAREGFGIPAQEPAQAPPSLPQEQPPEPAVFENTLASGQLAFLQDYVGRSASDVLKDGRYRKLLHSVIPGTSFHFGTDMPLKDAFKTVLAGPPLPVQIRDGQYMMVASRGGPGFRGRGFMWIDLQQGILLSGIYFHPTNGEPTPTLTIFSKQVKEESLGMTQLPFDFFLDLRAWAATASLEPIPTRYFINAQGKKIVLVHSEDFCGHLEDEPAPPPEVCEPMNERAADVDLEAAYFLAHAHYASNATLWTAGGMDQVQWLKFRTESCRQAPDPVRCRTRLTRERVRALIAPHPAPKPLTAKK